MFVRITDERGAVRTMELNTKPDMEMLGEIAVMFGFGAIGQDCKMDRFPSGRGVSLSRLEDTTISITVRFGGRC